MRKSTLVVVLGLAAALLAIGANLASTQPGRAQFPGLCSPLSQDLSTGIDSTGSLLPYGTPDPKWTVTSTLPGLNPPAYAVSPVGVIPPSGSEWIRPAGSDGNTTLGSDAEPGGPGYNYTYTVRFPLDLGVYQNPNLTFQFASDNESQVKLNGVVLSGGTFPPSGGPPVSVTVTTGFTPTTPYTNVLEVDVRNRLSSSGDETPTGLLVSGTLTADCRPIIARTIGPIGTVIGFATSTPTPPPAPCALDMVINTGTEGIASVDPLWTLTSAPAGVATPAAYGVATCPGWTAPPGGSGVTWIDPDSSGTASPQAAGDYWYVLTFDLTGYVNPQLLFNFAADNSVEFFLNGMAAADSLGPLGYVDTASTSFQALQAGWPVTQTTTPSLVLGPNTLYAHVTNDADVTGLLVAGDVTASCAPLNSP